MKNKKIRRHQTRRFQKKDTITILVVTFFMVMGGVFAACAIHAQNTVTPMYTYTTQKSNHYDVMVKANPFYETENLPEGGYYASQSIHQILIHFQYDMQGNQKMDLKYHYDVEATLIGTVVTYEEGKEVWRKPFPLLEPQMKQQEAAQAVSIAETVSINYQEYYDLVTSYEQAYGITIDAVLKVHLRITYDSLIVDAKPIEDMVEVEIPINRTVTEVKESDEKENTVQMMPTTENTPKSAIIYIGLAVTCWMVAMIVTARRMKIKKQQMTPEERYQYQMKQIKQEYGEWLVTVTNEPNVAQLQVLRLQTLEDFIHVAQQNQKHIVHYEVCKNRKSNLYVMLQDYAYLYEVT